MEKLGVGECADAFAEMRRANIRDDRPTCQSFCGFGIAIDGRHEAVDTSV